MLDQKLRQIVTEIEVYRNLPTIYNLQRMDISDRDGKMELAIRLVKVINGLNFQGSYGKMKLEIPFSEKKYNQLFASATSFYLKNHIVVWILVQILEVIINDLNMEIPSKVDYKILKNIINQDGYVEGEIREYDDFFDFKLSESEKGLIASKKKNNDINWLSDIDWKSMSFSFKLLDWRDYAVSERWHIMSLKNDDIINILESRLTDGSFTEDVSFIYSNIEKLPNRSKRHVYIWILTAVLFRQEYNIYPILNKNYDFLKELIAKEEDII